MPAPNIVDVGAGIECSHAQGLVDGRAFGSRHRRPEALAAFIDRPCATWLGRARVRVAAVSYFPFRLHMAMSDLAPAEIHIDYRIPPSFAREIGRAIVSFAHLEWMINRMLYFVLKLEDGVGRISVRDQDGSEQFKLLCRLLRQKDIDTKIDLVPISADIRSCQQQRNDIAHSVWFRSPYTENMMICLFRGEWDKEDDVKDRSRKITPEGRRYAIEEVINLVRLIDKTISSLEDLYSEIYDIWHT